MLRSITLAVLVLGLATSVAAAPAARRLSVVYDPPRLSVEVAGVSVAEVLHELGTKVGFTVVEVVASGPAPSLSVKNSSLEEVLRQLLGSENHVLLYHDETVGGRRAIDRIVLLGPRQHPEAIAGMGTPAPEQRSSDGARLGQPPVALPGVGGQTPVASPGAGAPTPPVTAPSPGSTGQSWIPLALEREYRRGGPVDPDAADATAADILTRHALGGVLDLELDVAAQATVSDPARRPSPADSPADVEYALAVTTRLAQRNLTTLVEGLATATSSLLGSDPAQRR